MRKLTRPFGKGEVVSSILTGSTSYSRKLNDAELDHLIRQMFAVAGSSGSRRT
jgi:hypothetical protein